jgi:hypothetical protein
MADEIRLAQESITDLANAIRGGNSSAPQSAAPAAAPAETPAGLPTAGLVNALIEAIGKLTAAITGSEPAKKFSETTQIATAIGGLKNASDLASGALSKLATEIPYLGAALKKFNLDLNEELQIARAGNQLGVGQGDSADLRDRALAAGFKSVQDYIEYLRSNYSNSLRTVGKTAEDSAQKLGDVATKAAATREGQNLLTRNLITSDQLAQIAGIAAEGKSAMLKDAEGRQALAEETAKLATMMDANAKVTGVSVDQQLKNRTESQKNTNDQLRMQALTSDQQRLQYSQNKALLEGQGKAMQDATSTIYSGGRLSKDQQQLLQAATGGRAGQYIQAVREQKQTANLAAEDPRRIEANRRLQEMVANMSAYQASPEFARRAQTTSNADQQRAMQTLQEQNTEKYAVRNIMQESGVTPAEARRRATEMGLQQGRGFRQEGLYNEKQVPNVGARTNEMLAEANEQVRKTSVALAGEINRLNNSVGRNTEMLDKVREAMNLAAGPKGETDEQRKAMVREYVNSITGGASGTVPGTDNATGRPLTVTTPAVNVNANNVVVQPTTPPATTPAPTTTPAPANTTAPETSRGKGTYGETGATAEIKDVVAQLHKGETVLTPDQRENMIKDSANAMFDKILGKKNSKESEDQNVQYKNVDKNDPEFVKMRQDNAAEQAERSKFMRSREVADPMYAGGKRFEMYDIREEEAKLNKAKLEEKDRAGSTNLVEMQKGLSLEAAQKAVEASLDKAVGLKTPVAPKVELPKIDLPKPAAINDPAQIKTPKVDTSFASRAEKMLESQTQGAFGNLRTAFANRQQRMSPNITDEFKNYQPKTATVTPAAPAPVQTEQPRFETRENVTIKDLNDQMIMLNKSIAQLVQISSATTNFAEQQIRVTKKLSGNRFG